MSEELRSTLILIGIGMFFCLYLVGLSTFSDKAYREAIPVTRPDVNAFRRIIHAYMALPYIAGYLELPPSFPALGTRSGAPSLDAHSPTISVKLLSEWLPWIEYALQKPHPYRLTDYRQSDIDQLESFKNRMVEQGYWQQALRHTPEDEATQAQQ